VTAAPDPVAFFAALDVVGAPHDLVALGGTLEPTTLVAAYRHGCFPWPSSGPEDEELGERAHTGRVPVLPGQDGLVPWCSPEPRAVLLPSMLRISRSLRRTLRSCTWEITVDEAFPEVMAGCAAREQTWITDRMREAYTALHRRGGAHSVEVWAGDRLVGGLYGIRTGGVFSGESMFHRETDASKVALVALVDRMREGGIGLLDTQQATEHMASLGQVNVSRRDYVEAVVALRDRVTSLPRGRRPAGELAPAHQDQAAVVR
jgi:leucyl/phenylalanyl-tRNA--protein transferase